MGLHGNAATGRIAAFARVGPVGPQAVQRIRYEGQWFYLHANLAERIGSDLFTLGGNCTDRFADVARLGAQQDFAGIFRWRHVVGCHHADDTFHRQRFAGVDTQYPAVRQRAAVYLAEDHAVDTIVFRVLRLAGDLAVNVRGREILADQVISHDCLSPNTCSTR